MSNRETYKLAEQTPWHCPAIFGFAHDPAVVASVVPAATAFWVQPTHT
jgi:hypothetical protein